MAEQHGFEPPQTPHSGATSTTSSGISSEPSHRFRYDPLVEKQFRLFLLDLNGEGDELSGSLMTTYHRWNVMQFKESMILGFSMGYNGSPLVMRELTGSQKYDTFSYCWGDQHETNSLHLSVVSDKAGPLRSDRVAQLNFEPHRNGTIQIGPNLKSLLEEMRRRKYNRFVWIDAICIDQTSDVEKRMQIPMMRDIFTWADDGYVWLGEGSSEEVEVMQMIPEIAELLEKDDNKTPPEEDESFVEVEDTAPQDISDDEDYWPAIRKIMLRPWWSRLWTLQEVALHAKKPGWNLSHSLATIVWLSDGTMELEAFVRLNNVLAAKGLRQWTITGSTDIVAVSLHGWHAIDEITICRKSYMESRTVKLRALLLATRRRKATLAADAVHGMLAMMEPQIAATLAPNADLTVQEVFMNFAKHYVRNEHKEHLFNHILTENRMEGLPSWCPNFASGPAVVSFGPQSFGRIELSDDQQEQMFHAGFHLRGKWKLPKKQAAIVKRFTKLFRGLSTSGGIDDAADPRQITLVPDSDYLLVSGMHIDTVAETVECNPASDLPNIFSSESLAVTKHWELQCRQLAMKYLSGVDDEEQQEEEQQEDHDGYDRQRLNAIARTISTNRALSEFKCERPDEVLYDYKNKLDFVRFYKLFREYLESCSADGVAPSKNVDKLIWMYLPIVLMVNRGRKFFATKGGRIGLGPKDMQVGDHVRVLFFCPTPYIFRQFSNGKSRLVGETYFHGFMYGEALEMLEKNELEEMKWVVE